MTREIVRARCAMQRAWALRRSGAFLRTKMDGQHLAREQDDLAAYEVVRAVVALLVWGLS